MRSLTIQRSTAQLYPFAQQTIIPNGLIQDMRIIANKSYDTVVVDQIKTKNDYLFLGILFINSTSDIHIKACFSCTKENIITKLQILSKSTKEAIQPQGFILLNKLPDFTVDYIAYSNQNKFLKLHKSVLTYCNILNNPVSSLDFQGYIDQQICNKNYDIPQNQLAVLVYRSQGPAYQLSDISMSKLQTDLLKSINGNVIDKQQTLRLRCDQTLQMWVQSNTDSVITISVSNKDNTLSCGGAS